MDLRDLLARVRITDIADALGVPRRNMRVKAVWRNGDDWTVRLNDAKGTWIDFKTNEGGGILDFIQIVLSCSRREAVSWLCEYMGVPEPSRPWTAREKVEYARKRASASAIGLRCAYWVRGYELELEHRKWNAFDRCDDHELESVARELYVLQSLDKKRQLMKYRIQAWHSPQLTRERIERGRDDMEHVEKCADAAIRILEAAREQGK